VVATPVPEAELVAGELLSLPVHPALFANDVERVVEVLRSALGE
jgi:dTDP-4-amino-4,6-dideoxygalactose transaminase